MITAIVGTSEYNLSNYGYLVSYDGVGNSPSHRISSRAQNQHGETDLGYRLDPRLATLVYDLNTRDLVELQSRRDALLSIFKPSNDIKLRFNLPNGNIRQLDVVYYSDMSLPWIGETFASQRVAITVKASDPTFYNPTQNLDTISGAVAGAAWEIPWAIPWSLSPSSIYTTQSITYLGTFLTYPIIKLVGPQTDTLIENQSTGDKLDFTGTAVVAGDYLEIDLSFGQKTIVDSVGSNQITRLTADSDLASFHIAPDGEVTGGVNTLRVVALDTIASSSIQIRYYTRYIGL